HSDAGPHLRCGSRSSGPPFGAPPIRQLGRPENQNPLAGQYLELADSNFAEVGAGGYDLIPRSRKATHQNLRLRGRSTFKFGIQVKVTGRERRSSLRWKAADRIGEGNGRPCERPVGS